MTRCNDNIRHLFSLSLLAFNRNQRLIIFSCSQDAITTSAFTAIHLSRRRSCLVCMILLFGIFMYNSDESLCCFESNRVGTCFSVQHEWKLNKYINQHTVFNNVNLVRDDEDFTTKSFL